MVLTHEGEQTRVSIIRRGIDGLKNIPLRGNTFGNDSFVLTTDHLDALRLDSSSLSPKDQEAVKLKLKGINQSIIKMWGQFIKEPLEDDDFAQRFIFMDRNEYKGISN